MDSWKYGIVKHEGCWYVAETYFTNGKCDSWTERCNLLETFKDEEEDPDVIKEFTEILEMMLRDIKSMKQEDIILSTGKNGKNKK